jgi:hypothetical protein
VEIDKIHSRFCKKVLGIPRCAANGAAEIKLSRESWRGKSMSLTLKYSQRILRMDCHEVVKKCYVWQRDTIKFESWSKERKRNWKRLVWHLFGRTSAKATIMQFVGL